MVRSHISCFFSVLLSCALFLQLGADANGSEPSRRKKDRKSNATIENVIIVDISRDTALPQSILVKLDAAMVIAGSTNDRFTYTPIQKRDSIAMSIGGANRQLTALELAKASGAQSMLFVRVNRFVGVLRVEVERLFGPEFSERSNGYGYAALRYRFSEDSILYDVPVLQALQRALALAWNDTTLFSRVKGAQKTWPADLYTASHITLRDGQKRSLSKLFENRVVVSYDAVNQIVASGADNPLFVAIDIETRDTIYMRANLMEVENYSAPTSKEIKLLHSFGVRYLVAAECIRQDDERVLLTMFLWEIYSDGSHRRVRKEDGYLADDTVEQLQSSIRKLTKRLLR